MHRRGRPEEETGTDLPDAEPRDEKAAASGSARTEEALRRAQNGSEETERRLFHKLWRFLLDRTRGNANWPILERHVEADDVAQSLWATLFRRDSLRRFEDRGEGSLRAWLGCCLDRHLLDLVRRHTAEKHGVTPASLEANDSSAAGIHPPSPDPGPYTAVGFAEWKEQCAAVLSERELVVWILRTEEERNFDAIGLALGISASAARGLLKRGRDKLRERGLLGADGGPPDEEE